MNHRKKWTAWMAALTASLFSLLAAGLAYAAPKAETGWGLPHDASKDGHRIDWLIQITGVFTIILFVIMCVWMVWASLKHNKNHKAEYDHGNSKHSIKVALGISAVIFFVVDGNLWVKSTIDVNEVFWNFAYADSQPNTVRIEVNSHQWAWDARYAGPDGKFNTKDDIVTLNDIRVPVNAPVVIQLASVDVIHSFYLPNFRVKMDAVPGTINKIWFQAKETGEFEIACAQHCGAHHYKMRGILTVLSPEDYKKWEARASELSASAYSPDPPVEPAVENWDAVPTSNWGWEWRDMQ